MKKYIRDGRSPVPEKEVTSKIMSAIRATDTKPEIALRTALHRSGLRGYRIHWQNAPGKPDIAYPGKKKVIFVHGCYWHRCPLCNLPLPKSHSDFWDEKFRKNQLRDKRKIQQLIDGGWKALVLWECEINDDIETCVERTRSFLAE